jgi:hypothetical protein
LIKEYEQQATVKELAQRFGILRMQFWTDLEPLIEFVVQAEAA